MTRLTKKQLNETVTITCYGKTEQRKRGEAMDFYLEGARCCDGCEAERYFNIYCDLIDGLMVCSDE